MKQTAARSHYTAHYKKIMEDRILRTMNFDPGLNREYARSLGRAFAGALLFSLPILMTMETWALGTFIDRERLALLLVLLVPVLVGLSYFSGFEETTQLRDAVIDAFVAIVVASVVAIVFLTLFGALDAGMNAAEWIGKLVIQAVPASIGALLAQSQFGRQREEQQKRRDSGDFGEYFFMCAGALFFAANVAPTEEVVLISYMMSTWQSIGLVAVSLTLMHVFVYSVEFKGQHDRPEGTSGFSMFLRFSVVGYVMALLISAYICWSIGRFDGLSLQAMLEASIVLGFPATVGAATARLVL